MPSDNLLGDILKACEIIQSKPYIKEWPVLLCTQEWFDKNKDNWKPEKEETETMPCDFGIEIKIVDKFLLGDCEYRFVPKKCMDSFMPVIVDDKMVGISTFYKGSIDNDTI
jgi:hypothetical protein